MNRLFSLFALILSAIFLLTACDDKSSSPTSPSTNTTSTKPKSADIRLVLLNLCEDASVIDDVRVRVRCTYENFGNATGSRQVELWVEQPKGSKIGSYTTTITLDPGHQTFVERVFTEPSLWGGDIFCDCGVR